MRVQFGDSLPSHRYSPSFAIIFWKVILVTRRCILGEGSPQGTLETINVLDFCLRGWCHKFRNRYLPNACFAMNVSNMTKRLIVIFLSPYGVMFKPPPQKEGTFIAKPEMRVKEPKSPKDLHHLHPIKIELPFAWPEMLGRTA